MDEVLFDVSGICGGVRGRGVCNWNGQGLCMKMIEHKCRSLRLMSRSVIESLKNFEDVVKLSRFMVFVCLVLVLKEVSMLAATQLFRPLSPEHLEACLCLAFPSRLAT